MITFEPSAQAAQESITGRPLQGTHPSSPPPFSTTPRGPDTPPAPKED